MKTCIQTLGIMLLAASLSYGKGAKGAGDGQNRPDPQKRFQKLDTDGNGSISLAEFKACPRAQKNEAKADKIFKKFDTDSSGSLTLEEIKAGRAAHKGKGGGKHQK
jgi:hypothetical protein